MHEAGDNNEVEFDENKVEDLEYNDKVCTDNNNDLFIFSKSYYFI